MIDAKSYVGGEVTGYDVRHGINVYTKYVKAGVPALVYRCGCTLEMALSLKAMGYAPPIPLDRL